jgi:DNA-binding response OmpR family regulator
MRLLVVEDHPQLRQVLDQGLRDEGHTVSLAADGEAALERLFAGIFDAVVLDMMLPKLDGLAVLTEMRRNAIDTPVLILTARAQVSDRVQALDGGADDYLVKPFAFAELLARLRVLARRRFAAGTSGALKVADLEIDAAAKSVRRGGRSIRLTAREFAVLECLALRRGRVVSRSALLQLLYESETQPESNVVEVYVRSLRKKLAAAGDVPLIHTRRGLGYVLEAQ